MTLREYQVEGADYLSRNRRAVVVSPAGSGKTIIAAAALDKVVRARHRDRHVRIGWLANTTEQVNQGRTALAMFPSLATQNVVVACAAAATDWSDRDVLVVDECHHVSALGWFEQVNRCAGARWGLTATPPTEPDAVRLFTDALGPVLTIDRARVGQSLAKAVVRWMDHSDGGLRERIDASIAAELPKRQRWWKGDPGQLWGQVAWQFVIDLGIVGNATRNSAAILAATNDRPTLVLVNKVEHGQQLAAAIAGARPCYSKMGAKARREVLADFAAGRCRCIVATSLADEGLDLPNAEVLVLVSGGRSKARTEQRTGRVLRLFAGKPHGVIYDFRDTFHPLPAKHARVRAELYRSLGYEGA